MLDYLKKKNIPPIYQNIAITCIYFFGFSSYPGIDIFTYQDFDLGDFEILLIGKRKKTQHVQIANFLVKILFQNL